MNRLVIAVLLVATVMATFVLATRFRRQSTGSGKPLAPVLPAMTLSAQTVPTNKPESFQDKTLRGVIDDYKSTNFEASITSAIAHQLIAERLRTNAAFYEWATNVATTIIVQFVKQSGVPIYGTSGFSGDALRFDEVTANSWSGLWARATYDPVPTKEGPLEFEVMGGVHPYITRVRNAYRMVHYQLNPTLWTQASRNLGHLDWSGATSPIEEGQVETLAQHAFNKMTGLDLNSYAKLHVDVSPIPNPYASHPTFKVITGSPNATLRSASDVLYPFATFSNNDPGRVYTHVSFEGEMVQTSPGHAEFVYLSAVEIAKEEVFELGEKFLGKGAWEQQMFDEIESMNTDQRGQVYRRIFIR